MPLSLVAVAKSMDIAIFHRKLPYKVEAVALRMSDGEYVVILNSTMDEAHAEFALAHEMGHIALGHFEKVSPGDKSGLICRDEHIENEADIFASELLIHLQQERIKRKGE